MIRNETTIRVRYVETDAMGFAHHANYLCWFEMARIEMMDSLNLSYKALEGDGFFLPVLGASLTYKKPAYFDDVLKIVSVVHGKPGIRIKFEYDVFREESLLATGTTLTSRRRNSPSRMTERR